MSRLYKNHDSPALSWNATSDLIGLLDELCDNVGLETVFGVNRTMELIKVCHKCGVFGNKILIM